MTRKQQMISIIIGLFILAFSLYLQVHEIKILILWLLPALYALAIGIIEAANIIDTNKRWHLASTVLDLITAVSCFPIISIYDDKSLSLKMYYAHYYVIGLAILVFLTTCARSIVYSRCKMNVRRSQGIE